MTENGPRIVLKVSAALCAAIRTKLISATEYCLQVNGQPEILNKTRAVRLRKFINEYQTSCDTYVQPLTYSYSTQIIHTTTTHPFSMRLCREARGAMAKNAKNFLEVHDNVASPSSAGGFGKPQISQKTSSSSIAESESLV